MITSVSRNLLGKCQEKAGDIVVKLPKFPSDDVIWQTFCQILRSLDYLSCSQQELGVKIGVGEKTIFNWERGSSEPRRSNKKALKELAKSEKFTEEKWPRRAHGEADVKGA